MCHGMSSGTIRPRKSWTANSVSLEAQSATRLHLDRCIGPRRAWRAILTTAPNELTATVHNRMPVVLSRDDEAAWLDPTLKDSAKLVPMLRSYPAQEMEAMPANPAMNKPTIEGPECMVTPGLL